MKQLAPTLLKQTICFLAVICNFIAVPALAQDPPRVSADFELSAGFIQITNEIPSTVTSAHFGYGSKLNINQVIFITPSVGYEYARVDEDEISLLRFDIEFGLQKNITDYCKMGFGAGIGIFGGELSHIPFNRSVFEIFPLRMEFKLSNSVGVAITPVKLQMIPVKTPSQASTTVLSLNGGSTVTLIIYLQR